MRNQAIVIIVRNHHVRTMIAVKIDRIGKRRFANRTNIVIYKAILLTMLKRTA